MFTCTVCGTSFTCQDDFSIHERSHADQLLSCDICMKNNSTPTVSNPDDIVWGVDDGCDNDLAHLLDVNELGEN